MSSLKQRVDTLEADLKATPMRHYVYHDLPFAIFCYDPQEEWQMRGEIQRLKTRLEHDTRRAVVLISLAELMWQGVEESEGIEELVAYERQNGFDAVRQQIQDYLSDPDWRPLPDLLAARLDQLDASRHIAFIVRSGALAPNIYRVSNVSLRFMGIAENEGRGSYHTKVYTDSRFPEIVNRKSSMSKT